MTLTHRLLSAFLVVLGLFLVGFCVSIYGIVRHDIAQESRRLLGQALLTLTVGAEVGPSGVEWEPEDRADRVTPGPLGEAAVWIAKDGQGRVLAASTAVTSRIPDDFHREDDWFIADSRLDEHSPLEDTAHRTTADWVMERRSLQAHTETSSRLPSGTSVQEPVDTEPETIHDKLIVTVGYPRGPARHWLERIAWLLSGVSLAMWLTAFVVGTVICRWALRPVTQVAEFVSQIRPGHLDERLPEVAIQDEVGQLTRSFNDLLARLQVAFDSQARFASDASHQLRTPLTALRGEIEVCLRRQRENTEYERVLWAVLEQTSQLQRIVESLLFLARSEHDMGLSHLEPLDLAIWLPEHLRSWNPANAPMRVVVAVTTNDACVINSHPVLLGELLNTLLDNAVKYSPPGQPVRVELTRTATTVAIRVTDHGPGIAAADLPRLFEPFHRGQSPDPTRPTGFGLGLSIARRISQALGATLSLESTRSPTEFMIRFSGRH